MTTYEIIRQIPAKGFNWTGFNAALRSEYVSIREATNRTLDALPEWDAAKGIRQIRNAAMEMACEIVFMKATQSKFIAPSNETLAWGGCLGGEVAVWTDEDRKEAATQAIAALAKSFA